MLLNKNSSSKSFCFTFLVLFYLCVYLYLYEEKIVVRTYTISLVKLQTLSNVDEIDQRNTGSNPEQKHDDGDQTKAEDTTGVVGGTHGPVRCRYPGAPGLQILSVVDMGPTKNKEGIGNEGHRLRNRHKRGSGKNRKRNSSGLKPHTDSGNDADCESTE